VIKPVQQVAQVSWMFAHDHGANFGTDFAMDGSGGKGPWGEVEEGAAMYSAYVADADEAADEPSFRCVDLTRMVHAELWLLAVCTVLHGCSARVCVCSTSLLWQPVPCTGTEALLLWQGH
jgi:hypothetical protein